ncbi:MAG: tyrosine-type recombinase/integrase [Anaerolineales bacterium]|nr:tyrosine-type recombinase/integrase [Anaerolineales bacterium]
MLHLSVALEEYLVARNDLSPKTLEDYHYYLRRWLEFAGDVDLAEMKRADLERFMAYMRDEYRTRAGKPLSQAGLANCWTALRSFWHWASDSRVELANISEGLRAVKVPEPVVEPFTKDEAQALIEACYRTALAKTEQRRSFRYTRHEAYRDVAILLVLLDTGIRVGELHRLNVGDIDLHRYELEVRPFRSGVKSHPRVIPFTRDTQAALLRWLSQRKELGEPLDRDGELLSDAPAFTILSSGERFPVRAVEHMLARLGKRAGVSKVHPHRFRHTFAIEYLRNGGDPWTLQRMLGHSTMEMVRRYLNFAKEDIRGAHSRASAVARWRFHIPK